MTLRNPRRLSAIAVLSAAVIASGASPSHAAAFCRGQRATQVGTPGIDFILGTAGADVIVADNGADQVMGRGGNDTICAGKGADYVVGASGDDIVYGGPGADDLFGDEGNDYLDMGPGAANGAAGGPGDDVLRGGPGLDLANFLDSRTPVTVDLEAGTASGEDDDTLMGIDGAFGSRFDDSLAGTDDTNILIGGGGSDSLFGRGNPGSLDQGPRALGVDILVGDGDFQGIAGNDSFVGGPGLNVADFTLAETGVTVDLSTGSASGEGVDSLTEIQVVAGSDLDDTLLGDDGDNAFRPSGGNDTVDGRGGSDVAVFTTSRTGVIADLESETATGEGSDTLSHIEDLWGSQGPDVLNGDDHENSIFGFRGADRLSGRESADVLNGGKGSDTLDGGEGDDRCTAGETSLSCEQPGVVDQRLPLPALLLRRPVAQLLSSLGT